MTLTQEKREGIQVQGRLLRGFEIRNGTLRIFEKEDGRYGFEWQKEETGHRIHVPRVVKAVVGEFLCGLQNETGDIARQMYKDWGKLKEESNLGKKYKIETRIKRSGRELLPHVSGGGKLKLKQPRDVINMVYIYWCSQD